MSAVELQTAGGSLGKAYVSNPNDKPTALRYATVLQMNGDTDQALAVMRKLAIAYPKDREVSLPTASRWPAQDSSNPRSTRSAAPRPPNIRTGSWRPLKAQSSTKWAMPNRREISIARRST